MCPGSCSCSTLKGSGREGSDLLYLPRDRYYPVRSVLLYCSTRSVPAADIRLWSPHSREFSVATTLAPLLCPGCQLLMSERCRKSSAVSKALSTANAGDWAENVNRASRVLGDLFSMRWGRLRAQPREVKTGSVRRVLRRHIRMRCFPTKIPESRSPLQ